MERLSVERHLQKDSLVGLKIAVQSVGHVGYYLCRHLFEAWADLIACDININSAKRVEREFEARLVSPEELYNSQMDVYSPCALGATINPHTINKLNCSIIAGAANNQLADDTMGSQLTEKGILYAPDYVINAGGIINISFEADDYNQQKATKRVTEIAGTLQGIYQRASLYKRPTNEIADEMAREILQNPNNVCEELVG